MKALQLKITLADSHPPIWRRVLIRADVTFWVLHSVIQDLFGWEEYHLHNFERFWKRNEDRYVFEIPHPDNFSAWQVDTDALHPADVHIPRNYFLDERKEKIGDWLTPEYPKFTYTYDFGDDWEHEIILEQIADVPELKLAKYLGGKRRGMKEDSRFYALLDCTGIIKASQKPSSELWQAAIHDLGPQRAEKLVAKAQKEARTEAPKQIHFSDPKQRYKTAMTSGLYDH